MGTDAADSAAALADKVDGRFSFSALLATIIDQEPSGRILLLGGEGANGPDNRVTHQDPASGSVTTLAVTLLHARAWHSATLLPDGTIVILGGLGTDGSTVKEAELFDPATLRFQNLHLNGVTSRAYHTATLLTDGRVLIAGGVGSGSETLRKLELWDYRSGLGNF